MVSFTAGTTYKKYDAQDKWFIIDVKGLVLGRVASKIAKILRGKEDVDFTPHINPKNHVVVINAAEIALTGKKLKNDIFYWHTNNPGGIKQRTKGEILNSPYPERVFIKAVERMMPKESPLSRDEMRNLHVYAGPEHKHIAQNPTPIDFATQNRKNKR